MIELEQTAEARSTRDVRDFVGGLFRRTFYQGVADAFVIPLAVIVLDVLCDGEAEMFLTEED